MTERCSTHPDERAAWNCQGCSRLLCPTCAAPPFSRDRIDPICVHCEGTAKPILLASEIVPHSAMIAPFLGWLGTRYGLVQLLVMGTAIWCARLPPWGRFPGVIVGALYLAALVGMGAAGQKRLPQTMDFMRVRDIGAMVLRFLVLMFPVIGGYIVVFSFFPVLAIRLWPAVKIGVALYMPAVLMLASFVPVGSLLTQPWLGFVLIARIPRAYARIVATVVLLVAVDSAIDYGFDTAAAALGDRYVLIFVGSVVGLVLPALAAYLMGWFAHEHAEALGLVRPDPEARFAWPGAIPRGTWAPTEAERGVAEPEPIVPIDVDGWEGTGTGTEEPGIAGERTIDPSFATEEVMELGEVNPQQAEATLIRADERVFGPAADLSAKPGRYEKDAPTDTGPLDLDLDDDQMS